MKKTSLIAGAALLPAAGGFALGFQYGPRLVGALFLLGAWVAAAQPAGGPPPDQADGPPRHGPHRHPTPLIVKALDTNGDGIIDAAEIANAPAALKTLDKKGDGKLTVDEYIGPWATNNPPEGPDGQRPPPPPLPPLITALDLNGDGIIDASEIANASASLLKLDKNGDGKLTRNEYLPPRPQNDGPRFGARGQGGPPPGGPGGPGGPDFDGPPPGGQGPDGQGPDGPPPGGPPPDGNGPPEN